VRETSDTFELMLFIVIETFKDTKRVGERYRLKGRMLPDGVTFQASWIDPLTNRCFLVVDATDRESLNLWSRYWDDLADFEIVQVVTSSEFWANLGTR
jgi:hypothetical protein